LEGGGDMSKKPRVYVWDVAARKFYSGSIAKGTVIRITDDDILLPANRNRVFTTNWDHFSKEHIIPHHGSRTTQVAPPKVAEFLLTALATTPRANAMIGDLNERLADEIQKLGRDRAVRLYWARTLRSLWPLLWRTIGKAAKWGAVLAAVRRLF
jgi:hypothetical protein